MQTTVFINYLKDIKETMDMPNLVNFIHQLITTKGETTIPAEFKKNFTGSLLEARANYKTLISNPVIETIMQKLNISETFNHDMLIKMITAIENANEYRQIQDNVIIFKMFQELEISLTYILRLHSMIESMLIDENTPKIGDNEKVIDLQIIDFDNTGISIIRFNKIIDTISEIYELLGKLLLIEPINLRIVVIETGSDIRISFKGAGEAITAFQNLIKFVWDEIRYAKLSEIDRELETWDKWVEVQKKIEENIKAGKIDPNECELFQKKVNKGIKSLTENGVTYPRESIDEEKESRKFLQDKRIKLLEPHPDEKKTKAKRKKKITSSNK